jgi:DNA invertase Pin-like site-specific DNA recombinase
MKTVRATMLTHDASIGRVEPGHEYVLDDDKAERWIRAGVATAVEQPGPEPPPQPGPQPSNPDELQKPEEEDDDEDDEEDKDDGDDEAQRAEAKKLYEAGGSQRSIAEALGVSRATVRRLLAD